MEGIQKKWRFGKIFPKAFFFFLPLFFAMVLLLIVIYSININAEMSVIKKTEGEVIKLQKKYISWDIRKVISDLMFLKSTISTQHAGKNDYELLDNSHIIKDFTNMMSIRKIYDQIRCIDYTGQEHVRVNYINGEPEVVKQEFLQNKSSRYYFINTMELKSGQVYISPFDLNVENGEIEKPLKPMIRFAVRISDNLQQGIIIVNYLGSTIIGKLSELSAVSSSVQFLVNGDGYWLKGLDPADEWGFMYPERNGVGILSKFPEAGKFIMDNEEGQLLTSEGLFSFATIRPAHEYNGSAYSAPKNTGNYWKCISYVSDEILSTVKNEKSVFFFILAFPIIVILGITSWFHSKSGLARKHAELLMQKAKEQAEKTSRSKSIFLANMSHEIRTPMNAIIGFTELLESKIKIDEQKEYLKSINASSKSLLTIINDILDLSKVESGKLEIEYGAVNIQTVIREMSYMFDSLIEEKGVKFIIEIEDGLPKNVIFDEVRLRQILVNLINNAVKFTLSGYIKLTATYAKNTSSVSSIDLYFTVQDTGIGIPANNIDKIFNTFEQGQEMNISRFGGTGLGLSITKNLVELMNGTISVESEEGNGSVFTIVFKDVHLASLSDSENEQHILERMYSVSFKPAVILIVDDIEVNRKLIHAFLERYNFRLYEAENGVEALKIMSKYKPDLIITDYKMPEMNGHDFILTYRKKTACKNIPSIMVTASVLKEQKEKMEKVADSFIRKPVSRLELINEMMRFLPYEVENEISDYIAGQSVEKKQPEEFLLDKEITVPEPFMDEIRNNYIVQAKQLQNEMFIDDIEEFGKEVKVAAEKYNYSLFIIWADSILKQVEIFDTERINSSLKLFVRLAEEMDVGQKNE